ncbi:hypothetical protein HD553DRAFT_368429 [Filobasidium floriforme]|uniref:uncharacterized protein n=1 Tax=Filobasidium floriforme TaxID=5210 RepID=UPI001E8EAFA2|nr:uncharacterized protein HD553DRAFT_368429 [Filobasidium floriforme]KAH8087533.1 hypothetical protein HD553DRAFT_368429 [Filobasidium floriforme]
MEAKKYVDLKNQDWKTVLRTLLTLGDNKGRREYLSRFVKRSNSGGTVENGLEATDLDSSQLPPPPTNGPYFMLPSQLYRFPRNTEKLKTGLLSFDREYDGVDESDKRRDDGYKEEDERKDDGCVDDEYEAQNQGEPLQVGSTFSKHNNPTDKSDERRDDGCEEDDECEDNGCVDDDYEDQNQGEPLRVGSTLSKHDDPTDESDERRDDRCEEDDKCKDDECVDDEYEDQNQGEPYQVGSTFSKHDSATLLALGMAIGRIQGYASLDDVTMCRDASTCGPTPIPVNNTEDRVSTLGSVGNGNTGSKTGKIKAEAVMNLALGLGQSGSTTSPQKQVPKAAGVQLHHLAMNDAVGWEAVAKRKGVTKVVCTIAIPYLLPTLLIGATSDAEADARREEAANLGVTVPRYRGPVSMLKTKSFTITSRSTRAGSYKYLELVGWGLAPIRITAKFMPKLWNILPEDLNNRVKSYVDCEYVVPALTAAPEAWIRNN